MSYFTQTGGESPIFKQLLSNIAKLFLVIIESDKKVILFHSYFISVRSERKFFVR